MLVSLCPVPDDCNLSGLLIKLCFSGSGAADPVCMCVCEGLRASTWTGDHGSLWPCTTGETGVQMLCMGVYLSVWLLVNTMLDSAVGRVRGLGAWYWSGQRSELDTGETKGLESCLLEEVGGPSQVLERQAWCHLSMRFWV